MSNLHPTAVIASGAEVADGVEIGPYCVLGPHVKVGSGARLHSHVVLDGWTALGAGCQVFPFASIGTRRPMSLKRSARESSVISQV